MKAVILAGGRGTRLAEETVVRPKPMVKIGDEFYEDLTPEAIEAILDEIWDQPAGRRAETPPPRPPGNLWNSRDS